MKHQIQGDSSLSFPDCLCMETRKGRPPVMEVSDDEEEFKVSITPPIIDNTIVSPPLQVVLTANDNYLENFQGLTGKWLQRTFYPYKQG